MQEVFEKIVERLEENQTIVFHLEGGKPTQSVDFVKAIEIVKQTADEYNNGWIPCSERLPNREEYLENDGKFIVTDGNRRYQSIFDIYSGKFKPIKEVSPVGWYSMVEDKCVIAWQPLPEPYQPKGE